MPLATLHLRPSNRPNRLILRTAKRTLDSFVMYIFIRTQTALMETVFAQKVYDGKFQGGVADLAARSLEDYGFGGEGLELIFFGIGVTAKGVDCTPIGGDFLAFALDGCGEVVFYHSHGCYTVRAQGLYDLQWGHQTVVVDLLEHGI